MPNTLDSNKTGLRYAVETSIGTLPGSPVWNLLEPNSYNDFGANISTVARNPITADRQRRKGKVTDLDAQAGFTHDMVSGEAFEDMLRSFMFAAWRKKLQKSPSAVTSGSYTVTSGTDYNTNMILFARNFSTAGNNGKKAVTAVGATTVSVSGLTAEASPPSDAEIYCIGLKGASGDLEIDASGADPKLTTSALDFTDFGFIAGEWLYIGGDATSDQFATAANNGFARIKSISATEITFDKTQGTMVTDAGTSKTVEVFFGKLLKNESDSSLISRQTLQLERQLDTDKFEYVKGCVANTMNFNFGTADKVAAELGFIATDQETATSAKSGDRPSLEDVESFNTTSDLPRLRIADTSDTGLATYVQEFSLTINNNASPNKAIGTLGAIDVTVGDFVVEGSVTAYFSDTATIDAVRNNTDVTFDFATVVDNKGYLFDLPLIAMSNGQVNVEKDQAIKIDLGMAAAADTTLNHTLMICQFDYLPTAAG